MDIRNTFIGAIINKDDDDRTLPKGQVRDALNIHVSDSEGSDVGSVEKAYGNEQLTNIDLGENVIEIGKYEDDSQDKLYWFTKSELGTHLMEWDNINQVVSIVLKDTREEDNGRVLNLKETNLITGISKIISEDVSGDLLTWTDDNIEICCINIERAKTWGENGFEKEDIYLIKKPPRYPLKANSTYTNDGSKNLENKFPSFTYRYVYLDGEYSALSDYTNYKFTPKSFDLDYFTLENKGMVSNFNAVRLYFNTGERQVTDIQLCAKFSNSNNIYVIETFNKSNKGWSDDEEYTHVFSNSKLYSVLAEKELYRSFDNIPPKAKALTVLENRINVGNYDEGMDIVDEDGNNINIDFSLTLITESIDDYVDFSNTILDNYISFENTTNEDLIEGKQLYFSFGITLDGTNVYTNSFIFVIEEDYENFNELFNSSQFSVFFDVINNDYISSYNNLSQYEIDPNYTLTGETYLSMSLVNDIPTFTVAPVVYADTANSDAAVTLITAFEITSYMSVGEINNTVSCKTNMGYEAAIEYQDEFNRRIPVLTSETNTLFIPQKYSAFKNKLRININNKAPKDADRYKICIKAKPLQYQIIYVNEFYNEDNFVWAKLVAENKDKVSVGDELIVKVSGDLAISEVITVKVLDIQSKEANFITDNTDQEENEILETEGVYMKIRPVGFSMDLDDFTIYQNDAPKVSSDGYPTTYMDLFTTLNENDTNTELSINQGSSIYLFIHSYRFYDAGQRDKVFEKTFFAQRSYDTLEEWFNEILLNGNSIPANQLQTEEVDDFKDNISLVRGELKYIYNTIPYIVEDPNGKLYLKITGLYAGGTRNRKGYILANIVIRNSTGFYAFETTVNQVESEIYYQTEQCFDIEDGNHLANIQNQESDSFTPAIIDLDFFNCYAQGNGIESYRYKDGFNTNYLNIDLRPSSTSIVTPKKIRRFADLTYGEAFIESTGLNGLNEFNASTANFKELDKQYGSVQRLFATDTNLLVWQEEKASKILFGKDLITTASGATTVSLITDILGQQVPIPGDSGIGTNPESLAWNGYRFYYINARKGTPIRLSMDGITNINNKVVDYFRDLFRLNPTSNKLGGFDPYHGHYIIHNTDEESKTYNTYCGNSIYKDISTPFSYYLNLNNLVGDIVINYNISFGSGSITAVYNNQIVSDEISGQGSITIPRDAAEINEKVLITLTPGEDGLNIELTNVCPIGISLNLYTIVLVDEGSIGKTVTNRFRWGVSSFYNDNQLFENFEINTFRKEVGLEGNGKFPQRDYSVNMQSYKDVSDTFHFNIENNNKLGYLITDEDYVEGDIETILSEATFIETSETQIGEDSYVNQGSFDFVRPTDNHNLYLIHDYRSPVVVIDKDTKIYMFFDKSGSMNATLTPLQTMRDTILKDRLLPFYNNDSDLYDASVVIQEVDGTTILGDNSSANERTLKMLDLLEIDPPEGNVIAMLFQDEASSIYHGASIEPRTATYDSDLAILRSRLNSYASGYYRGVIFQVDGQQGFKDFIEAVENGTGLYSGVNGLSDRNEFNFKYDIADGGTEQYYLDQIVLALTELGYNI